MKTAPTAHQVCVLFREKNLSLSETAQKRESPGKTTAFPNRYSLSQAHVFLHKRFFIFFVSALLCCEIQKTHAIQIVQFKSRYENWNYVILAGGLKFRERNQHQNQCQTPLLQTCQDYYN